MRLLNRVNLARVLEVKSAWINGSYKEADYLRSMSKEQYSKIDKATWQQFNSLVHSIKDEYTLKATLDYFYSHIYKNENSLSNIDILITESIKKTFDDFSKRLKSLSMNDNILSFTMAGKVECIKGVYERMCAFLMKKCSVPLDIIVEKRINHYTAKGVNQTTFIKVSPASV